MCHYEVIQKAANAMKMLYYNVQVRLTKVLADAVTKIFVLNYHLL